MGPLLLKEEIGNSIGFAALGFPSTNWWGEAQSQDGATLGLKMASPVQRVSWSLSLLLPPVIPLFGEFKIVP